MKIFTGIDLTDDNPPGICQDCAQHGLVYTPSGAVFVYCTHTGKGAAREHSEAWMIFEGLTAFEFKQKILDGVLTAEIVAGEMKKIPASEDLSSVKLP